jgi:starvation-inducible DNA-binding protein
MDKDTYIAALKATFASHFALYLKAHGFHWNLVGSDFYQYHGLFEAIYSEIYGSIDTFAEELRALDEYAPASLSQMLALTKITDENAVLDIRSMANELYNDCENMAALCSDAFDLAEMNHDHGLSNFLADRQDAFKKHCWMLRSSLK